jgi:hypothetical protein
MPSDLRAYRIQSYVVDVATGFSTMSYVSLMPGTIAVDVRYRSGQTGFIVGATIGGATVNYPVTAMTLGIVVPTTAVGGIPVQIPGPAPFYLGSLGTSGVVFEVTRYFSAGS